MDPTHPSEAEYAAPRRTWWGRNWKWIVPVGCLTPILVCGGVIGLIVSLVFGLIKSSDVYERSLAAAQQNPALQQAIGTPIEPAFLVTGSVEITGPSGSAELAYDVSGPRGEATVYAVATKQAGKWQFTTLEAEVHGTGRRIDLQPAGAGAGVPATP